MTADARTPAYSDEVLALAAAMVRRRAQDAARMRRYRAALRDPNARPRGRPPGSTTGPYGRQHEFSLEEFRERQAKARERSRRSMAAMRARRRQLDVADTEGV